MNPIYAHYSPTNKQASAGDFFGVSDLERSKERALERLLDNPGAPSYKGLVARRVDRNQDSLDPQTAALTQDPEVRAILKQVGMSPFKRFGTGALRGAAVGSLLGMPFGGIGALPGAGIGGLVGAIQMGYSHDKETDQLVNNNAKLQALKAHVKSVIAKHKLEQENPAHHIDPADIDESAQAEIDAYNAKSKS